MDWDESESLYVPTVPTRIFRTNGQSKKEAMARVKESTSQVTVTLCGISLGSLLNGRINKTTSMV